MSFQSSSSIFKTHSGGYDFFKTLKKDLGSVIGVSGKKKKKPASGVKKKKPVSTLKKKKPASGKKKPVSGVKKKKPASKKKPTKKGGGTYPLRYFTGGGSDIGSTMGSSGNINAPDGDWAGVGQGETHFRQFNTTGDYIPTSDMNRAFVLEDGILGHKLAGGKRGGGSKRGGRSKRGGVGMSAKNLAIFKEKCRTYFRRPTPAEQKKLDDINAKIRSGELDASQLWTGDTLFPGECYTSGSCGTGIYNIDCGLFPKDRKDDCKWAQGINNNNK